MFLTPLKLEATRPGLWSVLDPLVWQDERFGLVIVPPGTVTDLASIPRRLRDWPLFDPNGVSRRAAVGHDFLYFDGTRGKAFADDFLRAALIVEGMSKSGAALYYWAVRGFGGAAWKAHRTRQGGP